MSIIFASAGLGLSRWKKMRCEICEEVINEETCYRIGGRHYHIKCFSDEYEVWTDEEEEREREEGVMELVEF